MYGNEQKKKNCNSKDTNKKPTCINDNTKIIARIEERASSSKIEQSRNNKKEAQNNKDVKYTSQRMTSNTWYRKKDQRKETLGYPDQTPSPQTS